MKGVTAALGLLFLGLCLLPHPVLSNDKEQATALFDEAKKLQEKAQSKEDLQKALNKYEEALKIFSVTGLDEQKGKVLNNIGKIYLTWSKYDTALEFFQKALLVRKQSGDRKGIAESLKKVGDVHLNQGHYDQALRHFQKAVQIAQACGAFEQEAAALTGIGVVHGLFARHRKALEFYRKSLKLNKKISNRRGEGDSLNSLGNAHYSLSELAKAETYYRRSLALRKEVGDTYGRALTLGDLGDIYSDKGEYRRALKYYKQAGDLFGKLGSEWGTASVARRIASLKRKTGDYDSSLRFYRSALDTAKKIGDSYEELFVHNCLGHVYCNRGQYEKALQHYREEFLLAEKMGIQREKTVALSCIANVNRHKGKFAEALSQYQESLKIYLSTGDLREQIKTYNRMGHIYSDKAQYEKALEYYGKQLSIAVKMGIEREVAVAEDCRAGVYGNLGKYGDALDLYKKALRAYVKIGDRSQEAGAYDSIGSAYRHLSRYQQALEYYRKSLAITRKIGELDHEGATLNNIGLAYQNLAEYGKAVLYFKKALAISRKIGDVSGEGAQLANLGGVCFDRGEYKKALSYYGKAMTILRKLGDLRGEGTTLSHMGLVYNNLGQYKIALSNYDKALAISRKIGDVDGEGTTLSNMGLVYSGLGQYKKALEHYGRPLAIRRKIGDVKGESVTLGNVAGVYSFLGQYKKALKLYKEALKIAKRIGVPYDDTESSIGDVYLDIGDLKKAEPILRRTRMFVSLGRLALRKGEYREAIGSFRGQLEASKKDRNANGLFCGHAGLGIAYEAAGQYDKAIHYYKKAIDLTERIRDSLTEAQRVNFYDVKIWGIIPRIAPYEGLARVLLRTSKQGESLRRAEATRARSFAEALSHRGEMLSSKVPLDVMEKDLELNNRLAALLKGLQKAREKASKDAIESFEKQVEQARAEKKAHIARLRKDYPLFAATKYPQPMGLDETALKENEWVLEYEVTDSGICIYLCKGKEIVKALFKPMERSKLDALVRRFREPLELRGRAAASKLKAFDFVAGEQLSDLLLAEVLPHLPAGKPLIIVPDDSLGVLPFEMLVLNEGGKVRSNKEIPYVTGADFFGDRNPISYYQSITALTLARTLGKQKKPQERLLVMADPVFRLQDARAQQARRVKVARKDKEYYADLMVAVEEAGGGDFVFNRLPLTGELAEKLEKIYGSNADIFTGLKASKKLFLGEIAPKLSRYGTVVLGTHGYFNKDNPGFKEPILALTMVPPGTDGFLRLSEVMGLKMNSDIVALTACQTGLGRRISGEGVMGMGRAFQYAGAKSVLTSLWSVAEVSSAKLVESFFRHLKEGKSKLESLRLARIEIRKAGYDHPFFWAPFILVGEVK